MKCFGGNVIMINILFVCHGNICRSPMAEFVLKDMVKKRGLEKDFFKYNIKPLLKENGEIYIAVPGLKDDYEKVPKELKYHISEEDFKYFKSINYWENLIKNDLKEIEVLEMKCFDEAWQSWLSCDNPYAAKDIELLKADNGKFLNLISIKGKI